MGCARYNTAIGVVEVESNGTAITRVSFVGDCSEPFNGNPTELTDLAFEQIDEYLAGNRQVFDIPIYMKGTNFQLKVWNALLQIPYGQTKSYGQIASAIGNHKASRAVGMANNRNPIAIIIPCHRVIGANGGLVGYAAGLSIKKNLLQIESDNCGHQLASIKFY